MNGETENFINARRVQKSSLHALSVLKEISKYKKRIRLSDEFSRIDLLLKTRGVNTICHSAACPNIGECFRDKKMTFLILGDTCTRNCKFCNVLSGETEKVDQLEKDRILSVVNELKLKYVVITSVTRDDLPDHGCSVFRNLSEVLKNNNPDLKVEILIPDMNGDEQLLKKIAQSRVEVIGHNVETIERLYPVIRPSSDFKRSLRVLRLLKKHTSGKKKIKTGFMVGLGENMQEIEELLKIIHKNNIDMVTVGQYFQPSLHNVPVNKYYSDEEFKHIKEFGDKLGFEYIFSGRYVRSSYSAEEVYNRID